MYKIYIDTTKRFEHFVRLFNKKSLVEDVCGDVDVISVIDSILKKHKLKPSDITLYESNPGPGSFMGIKVGITIANVLNFILGKKRPEDLQKPEYGREPNITLRP